MKNHVAVAIDGPSAAGKSSVAKAVAQRYGYIYVDTGAIYRTVGLAAQNAGLDSRDTEGIVALLPSVDIDISYDGDGTQAMLLNGADVSMEIRTPKSSIYASDVSTIPEVRAFLLNMQRDMAEKRDVIMDGRDIGTVVLPDASLKLFLTASAQRRAERRFLELREKGVETTLEEVLHDIEARDYADTHRETAPLRQAEDAVLVDTSDLTLDESIDAVCAEIRRVLEAQV